MSAAFHRPVPRRGKNGRQGLAKRGPDEWVSAAAASGGWRRTQGARYAWHELKRIGPETLCHRELRNRSDEVLRRVQEGATFQVTKRGEVVAVIGPAGRCPELRVRRARTTGGFASLPRVRIDTTAQDHLDELRGER